MTDGILLAEMQRDRMLRQYDTLIIDEAHERSLNIDFILGYLQAAAAPPPRPEGDHHLGDHRPASGFAAALRRTRPIVEVSGRTYPVEMRYRPGRRRSDEDDDARSRDQIQAIVRRRRRAVRRGPGRHPGVPQRRAGDPRHRRRAATSATLPQHRDPAAVRPAVRRRAAPGLPAHTGAPGRAGHQRRRDLADRARHPVRGRPGHRPHLPLQPPHSRCSGCRSSRSRRPRQPAQGPLRPYAPTASASGCTPRRTSRPAGVHRPGDPAHQPRLGHPADDRARARRHRGVPVRRPARPAQRHATASTCCTSSARFDRRGDPATAHRRSAGKLARLPVDPRLARMVLEADAQRLRPRGAW